MDKKLMLEQLISHFTDGNKAQFAAKIGISPQNLSQWLNRGTFDAEMIYANCDGVSPRWLPYGHHDVGFHRFDAAKIAKPYIALKKRIMTNKKDAEIQRLE